MRVPSLFSILVSILIVSKESTDARDTYEHITRREMQMKKMLKDAEKSLNLHNTGRSLLSDEVRPDSITVKRLNLSPLLNIHDLFPL